MPLAHPLTRIARSREQLLLTLSLVTVSYCYARHVMRVQNRLYGGSLAALALIGMWGGPPRAERPFQGRVGVRIDLVVLDSDGEKYSGRTVAIANLGDGTRTTSKLNVVDGEASLSYRVPWAIIGGDGIAIELHVERDGGVKSGDSAFFFSPEDGKAAFATGLEFHRQGGDRVAKVQLQMSLPPKFCTLLIDNQNPDGAKHLLTNIFNGVPPPSTRLQKWIEMMPKFLCHPLDHGPSTVTLYHRRTDTTTCELVVRDCDRGPVLTRRLVRRNSTFPMTVHPEVSANVTVADTYAHVDELVRLDVLIVEADHHAPNPDSPHGADLHYDQQRLRALHMATFNGRPDGASKAQVRMGRTDVVAEVWMTDFSTLPVVQRLVDSKAVTAGQLDQHSFVFE